MLRSGAPALVEGRNLPSRAVLVYIFSSNGRQILYNVPIAPPGTMRLQVDPLPAGEASLYLVLEPIRSPWSGSFVRPVLFRRIRIEVTAAPSPPAGAGSTTRVQGRSLVRSYQRTFGNSWAGAKLDASYRALPASLNQNVSLVSAEARGTGQLLNRTFPLFEARAEARTPGETQALLRIGKWDLVNQKSALRIGREFSRDFRVAEASHTFMVGPIPVTLRGWLGVRVQFRMDAQASAAGAAGNMTLAAHAYGGGSAEVNAVVVQVGLRADIKLLNASLEAGLRADIGGFEGYATATFQAVSVDVFAYVTIGIKIAIKIRFIFKITINWKWELKKYESRLIHWSSPASTTTVFRF
ncbi:MAG: hypothetical protein HY720_18030 [Planctomycetes bacterium]|nr:hypothetical protein [Planctomycetota bacterium]